MAKKNVTVYDLLVSCPGDLDDLILIVRDVVDMFNSGEGIDNNTLFRARYWKTDAHPAFGDTPQHVLNKEFIEDCDMAVACFWTSFGTPTDEYLSGTESEIELMLREGKQVFLYFFNDPINPDLIDMEQYQKVKEFKKKCQSKGFYCSINKSEFKSQFFNHLSQYFRKEIKEHAENLSVVQHTDHYVKKKF